MQAQIGMAGRAFASAIANAEKAEDVREPVDKFLKTVRSVSGIID